MKKGMAPIMATGLLVLFALAVGVVAMSWAQGLETEDKEEFTESVYVISVQDIDTDLERIMIDYLTGRITLEEYSRLEKEISGFAREG